MSANRRSAVGFLSVVAGPDKGKQVKVDDRVHVGRDARLELEISDGDTGVHRNPHFAVYARDGVFHLNSFYEKDTRVNGQVVQSIQLHSGDIIEIGYRTKIRFSTEEVTGDYHVSNPDTPTRF
jgi:predicted component of type VI protein secretion system